MSKKPGRYSCKKVIVICGTRRITGFADDSFLEIEPHGDGTEKVVGCGGETARSFDPDNTYGVNITLMQTSDDVAWLQRRYDLDRNTGRGDFPIIVQNLMGGELFTAPFAWVKNDPTHEFAKTAGNRQIELDTGDGIWNKTVGV
jgi:hypothetical protein